MLRIAFDDTLRYRSPRFPLRNVLPPPEYTLLSEDVVRTQIRAVPCHIRPRRVGKDLTSSIGESCTEREVEDVHEGEFLSVCMLPLKAVIDGRVAYIAGDIFLLREDGFIYVELLAQFADEVVENNNVGGQSFEPIDV